MCLELGPLSTPALDLRSNTTSAGTNSTNFQDDGELPSASKIAERDPQKLGWQSSFLGIIQEDVRRGRAKAAPHALARFDKAHVPTNDSSQAPCSLTASTKIDSQNHHRHQRNCPQRRGQLAKPVELKYLAPEDGGALMKSRGLPVVERTWHASRR
jgi:hypothetical protein